MAGKATAAAKAVRLGVRYAPVAYQAVKQGRAPAQKAVQQAYTRLSSRRQALAHAATLIDGSALRAFAGDDQVWVVFSGDQPVAVHPATDVPLETLLQHVDLSRRVRPQNPSAQDATAQHPSDQAPSAQPARNRRLPTLVRRRSAPAAPHVLAEAPEDD